jgi:hypothetical protein
MSYKDLPLIIDVSHYQSTVDFAVLKKNGIAAVIAKSSEGVNVLDDKFAKFVQDGYNAGIPVLAYHFFDPAYLNGSAWGEDHWTPTNTNAKDVTSGNQDLQLLNMKKALLNKKIYGTVVDLERWWIDYTDYYQNRTNAKAVPNAWITALYERFQDAVEKTWPDKQTWLYTSYYYVKERMPDVNTNEWLKKMQVNLWIAHWTENAGNITCSWDELRANHYPADTFDPMWFEGRRQTVGGQHWSLWQWGGDRYHLPGVDGACDLNFYNGTLQQFYDLIGFSGTTGDTTPVVIPDPVVTPVVTGLQYVLQTEMNVRAYPNTSNVRLSTLPAGTVITPVDVAGRDVWAKLENGTYVCMKQNDTVFAKLKQ